MSIAPGTRLGHYEVAVCVGVGGMGEVYRARDTRLGRDVALKILPDVFARDQDRLTRFEREARTLASLNHPNIAQIHGLEESGRVRALVLEYVEGPTMQEILAGTGHSALGTSDALPIARQIALALEAAHDVGVIHRDLKPANIKVRADGTVKVLDFGLAKALDVADGVPGSAPSRDDLPTVTSPAMTGMGVILGTAAYMSPEQARGKPVDRRADIWAFGCVLYEMLTGRRAFQGDDVSTTLAAVIKDAPDMNALPADLPASLRRLLRRCLEKDPRNRLSAIGDARLELEEREEPVAAVTTTSPPPRPRWRAIAAAAAIAAAITAGAMSAWLRPAPTAATPHRLSILPPEKEDFYHDAAAAVISPDGQWVVFTTAGLSAGQLWIREIRDATPHRIDGVVNAQLPFWSPDSTRIGYFANKKLMTIPRGGGRPTEVCGAESGRGGTWNNAGVIVFSPANESRLLRVPATGGDPVPATELDTARKESGHRFPFFLPDGDHFLYAALPWRDKKYEISIGSLSGGVGSRERIGWFESTPIYAPEGHLLFVRRNVLAAQRFDVNQRRLVGDAVPLDEVPGSVAGQWHGAPAVSVAADGALLYLADPRPDSRLVWFDRSGRETGTVDVPPARYVQVALSPDDKRVAVVRDESPGEFTIWIVDFARPGSPRPITQTRAGNVGPLWSHNGERLYFTSDRNGSEQIYQKSVDDPGPEKIAYSGPGDFKTATSVSPDGKWLIVQALTSQQDLWMVPLDGAGAPQPILSNPDADDAFAKISPDGKWLAYVSNKNKRFELFVRPFPGLDHEFSLGALGDIGQVADWDRNSHRLMVVDQGPEVIDLLFTGADVRAGTRRPLLPGPPRYNILHGDISSDFERGLLVAVDPAAARRSLTHVTGWTAALGAK